MKTLFPKHIRCAVLVTILGSSAYAFSHDFPMKINIHIEGEQPATATLLDNPAARDFASLLPLSLQLENYAQIERIAYLPRKLTNENAPAGFTPKAGDITYYAPWGNLAIFMDGFRYSSGLLPLGKLDESSLPLLQKPGPYTVRIEQAQQD